MPGPADVDAYIAAQPETRQGALRAIRAAILAAIPEAEETMAYKMPAYRVGGRLALYFAGWAKHIALYPTGEAMPEPLADDAAPYRTGRGTLQFPLTSPLPLDLVRRIARQRAGGDN